MLSSVFHLLTSYNQCFILKGYSLDLCSRFNSVLLEVFPLLLFLILCALDTPFGDQLFSHCIIPLYCPLPVLRSTVWYPLLSNTDNVSLSFVDYRLPF